jgi:hypothetical protein
MTEQNEHPKVFRENNVGLMSVLNSPLLEGEGSLAELDSNSCFFCQQQVETKELRMSSGPRNLRP